MSEPYKSFITKERILTEEQFNNLKVGTLLIYSAMTIVQVKAVGVDICHRKTISFNYWIYRSTREEPNAQVTDWHFGMHIWYSYSNYIEGDRNVT